jgi:hypothetical protein
LGCAFEAPDERMPYPNLPKLSTLAVQKRDQGCLAVDCNGAGVLLRTAEADCALSDELLFERSVEETQPLFFVKRLQDITTVPLLLLQVRCIKELCLQSSV